MDLWIKALKLDRWARRILLSLSPSVPAEAGCFLSCCLLSDSVESLQYFALV